MLLLLSMLVLFGPHCVDGLTCLQCDGVSQPRICSKVVDCFDGEYCSAMKVLNQFGEHVYNLGCHTQKVCENFTSTEKTCSECCETNLCNAEACGEPGYPAKRGPICFNCPAHTISGPCHDIDFCLEDETCIAVGKRIFSAEVFTSKCVSKHSCKNNPGSDMTIIGKRDVSMVKRTQQHTCDLCCDHDLCNRDCSTAHLGIGTDDCIPNPCHSGGMCHRSINNFTCTCVSGYTGAKCENECYSTTPWDYIGKRNVTVSGKQCQRWDAQQSYTNLNYFPESTLSEAENYCRNPDPGQYDPWCLIPSGWEFCGISKC